MIFPEGGNFTPERRQRQIDKLRRLGLESMARRAERMENVLAPRPGGLLAALDAAPDADVVLVAHTGLDHLLTVRDIWRELPMDKQIIMRWWRVPREEIPEGRDERIDWLFSLVGADRRLGRGAPTGRPAARADGGDRSPDAWPRRAAEAAVYFLSTSISVTGLSGVVASCGTSAASEAASLGSDAAVSSASASARWAPRPGHRTAGGRRDRRGRRGVRRLPAGRGLPAPSRLTTANAMPPRPSTTSSERTRCFFSGASTSPLRAAATALPRFLVSARVSSVASSTAARAAVRPGARRW